MTGSEGNTIPHFLFSWRGALFAIRVTFLSVIVATLTMSDGVRDGDATAWDGFAHASRLAARRSAGTPLPDVRIPPRSPELVRSAARVPVLRRQDATVGSGRASLRGSRFCFTYQSETTASDQDLIACAEAAFAHSDVVYWVYGIEHAPTTGQRHLQGYFECPATIAWTTALRLLPIGCHLEVAKWDAAANVRYCKKDGAWKDWGAPKPGRGARSDLEAIRADLDAGVDMRRISQDYFGQFIRYSRGFQLYRDLHRTASARTSLVLRWFYGPTGSGKTMTLQRLIGGTFSDADSFWLEPGPTGTWWDGYDGQTTVVFDELRSGWFPHNILLRIFQCAPYSVPIHGAKVVLCATTILITSNQPPQWLYREDPSGALMRRVRDFAYVYELLPDMVRVVSTPAVLFTPVVVFE